VGWRVNGKNSRMKPQASINAASAPSPRTDAAER
jgi:hypothetical protein